MKENRYMGMMTSYTWMFLSSFKELRKNILENNHIVTLVQPEYHAFFEEANVPICGFVIGNQNCDYIGEYIRLEQFKGSEKQESGFLNAVEDGNCDYRYTVNQRNFIVIPDMPIAYWLSNNIFKDFEKNLMQSIADLKQGLITGDNERFLRYWPECNRDNISCNLEDKKKWHFYHKGGLFRRWYGNISFVVDWGNDGFDIINFRDEKGKQRSRPQNIQYYFREGFTWTALTIADFNVRYLPKNSIFDAKGSSGFVQNSHQFYYAIGFCNSKVCNHFLSVISPTMDYNAGVVAKVPFVYDEKEKTLIDEIVNRNLRLSKTDWDSFETSWDFQFHPLAPSTRERHGQLAAGMNAGERRKAVTLLSERYKNWGKDCEYRFSTLKQNEEELNRIFIDIYGLQDELTSKVADKDVTVARIYDTKEEIPDSMKGNNYVLTKQDVVKSLISYAVGCMMGRYSPDVGGLAYAGGKWDNTKYKTFQPDGDAILPICDDEYFDDDIVGRFVQFVEVVYGKDTMEENLQFIADALGGRGTPREVIRNYFLTDFYADHVKTYQKRPIYWLFDSGKKNGFKCLVYMHRYRPDTLARIRTDYIHEQQSRYRTAMETLERGRDNAATAAEKVKLGKKLAAIEAQAKELQEYEEKIHHLADQMIAIDLDDGVKHNYALFKDVLAKIK